jgi:hypothetical protein
MKYLKGYDYPPGIMNLMKYLKGYDYPPGIMNLMKYLKGYDYPPGTPSPDQGRNSEPSPTRTPCRMSVWFVDRKQTFHSIRVTELTTYLITTPFNYTYAPTYIIATQCLSYYYPPT